MVADDLVVIGHGRIVAQGTKTELLAGAGSVVPAPSTTCLVAALAALAAADIEHTVASDGAVLATAETARIGAVTAAAGVPLTELRSADGAGPEEMSLQLTATSQRDGAAARPP